jgi:predicted ferric reductase
MNYSLRRGLLWVALFTVLALIPMAIGAAGALPAVRSVLVEFGVALGFVGLALFALQFLFSGRIKRIAPRWGMDNIIQYHREIGLVAVAFILAHPIILIAADRTFLAYFDVRANAPRAVLLILVTIAALLIIASSIRRPAFRLQYEWWRALHGALALFIVFVGLVHALQVRHYLAPFWKQALLTILIGAPLYALAHTRVVRPWLSRRRPYRVTAVQPERDSSWSVTLEPVGHDGMRFTPGQFAWLTINETPFTLQQHPFSFASSARRPQITFTAKELGDFTATWKDIEPGTRAFLEGPFGAFTAQPSPQTGLFLVMGGIGVTPAMSMLRTLRDSGERRHAILIYGNKDWENVAFREELEELRQAIDLEVVHILEEPPDFWMGERGFVTRELLEKYLPAEPATYQYFICGPAPLMDVAEIALRDLSIPWDRIYTERFEIV